MKRILFILLLLPSWQVVAETESQHSLLGQVNQLTTGATNQVLVMRDPFSEPQSLNQNDKKGLVGGLIDSFGQGFRRTPGDVKVPQLLFKGFIDRGESKPPMALLQIAGSRVHMVQEGDEINIDPANPRQAIRITKISRLSITVETGTLGQMKVLR